MDELRTIHIKNYNLCGYGNTKILRIQHDRTFLYIDEILPQNIDPAKCLISYNCKIISPYDSKIDRIILGSSDTIELIPRVQGGFDLSMDDIIDSVMSEFGPAVGPLKSIANVCILILKILLWIVKFVIWLIQLFIWFLVDFCNPLNLATDLIGGITKITRLIFAVASDVIFGLLKFGFNKFLEPIFSGFWGWDNALTPEEKKQLKNSTLSEKMTDTNNGELKQSACHGPGVKCYRTPDGYVPFSVILGTVLLPPMGLFMEFGLTNWINIVICGILTMVYYVPGLIYALILIYS
jgi:uncharacterized membrane protein YqaE (UPF0057 family)